MKKYLIFFVLSFASSSYGNLLDDWSNDDLCVWMEFAATPEYIQIEASKREIICYGGVEVSSLPVDKDVTTGVGTVFPSPDSSLIPEIKPDKEKSYSY